MGNSESSVKIGKKAFLGSVIIIFVLMIISGIMGRILPAGSFDRVVDGAREVVVSGSFHYTEAPDYPIWRWLTAPVEVLWGADSLTIITLSLLIIFISGSVTVLETAGVITYILDELVEKFRSRKYLLMAMIIFLFMFLASFLGIYEGLVPLILFIVPLAHSLGWDSLTGLGMSLMPLAFGFSSAVTNPFTIGVAQKIAELPLFSGAWYRIIFFVVVYFFVYLFVSTYAKKIERKPELSIVYKEDLEVKRTEGELHKTKLSDSEKKKMSRAVIWFTLSMTAAIIMVLLSSMVSALSDLAFPLMGLFFLIGGIGSAFLVGIKGRNILRFFGRGTLGILPGILLVLMAYSVKHIIDQAQITDTILYLASGAISKASPDAAAFLVYALTLGMNFFIGSASAKAFLMMPILTPLADLVGITRQTAVLAFDFGDGFSNMVYPSNALLLIALGFTVVSYPKWIRWTFPLQLVMLGLTCAFLWGAVQFGFGPF
ncbi:YfcC family protein [Spirochaeta isovalerica]|uniref:Putative ion transporter superfamily protein YfcC n=1 Tax=Spirochaeta isovalerica TaxID=150 RepID=A0A841REK3_9SPIO|nr:Na+/H+ antiporter NhaC family protein [Spirochaeta isovalerica]MBB6481430.1 putative ion transporter superfamily protein YfcC [Spirochaeta isovalerica]